MTLLHRVRRFVAQHALFAPGMRVVAAVSGGSDSVALATLMRELADAGDLCFAGIAHFNHQLRDTAGTDETSAAAVALTLAVPFAADRADVRARARRERRSLEDAARAARYEFFERARQRFDADVVALGHTRDDQAETFLLRLLRGAGARGLAAMYPRRATIVRPLLDCSRQELRRYLENRHIAYVEDETNRDVAIPRNRVRAELVPLLADRFNPSVVDVLAHEAELARETWEWLEAEAAAFEKGERTPAPFARRLDIATLTAAPRPLRRLVLWRAMTAVADGRPVSFAHVEAVLPLLEGGGAVDAPGQRVERVGQEIVLRGRPRGARGRTAPKREELNTGHGGNLEPVQNLFSYPLSIPGEVQLPEAGCSIEADVQIGAESGNRAARSGKGRLAEVRRDLCRGSLTVRNRRPGDRFRPVGLHGRKKLQDYFVDRKVAAARRDLVPVVVDETGRIVWVAGYGIDEAFRVTDPSQSVLLLRLKLLGGPA